MHGRTMFVVGLLASACSPSASEPSDAATIDAHPFDANLLTDAYSEGAAAPNVACGPDVSATLGFDPCLNWVICLRGEDAGMDWAATYSNGTCEAARCTFADAPVLIQCPAYCFQSGPMGRCANPGPTAP